MAATNPNWNSMSVQDLLKSGTKHMQGMEEAIFRNIEACKDLSKMTRTSYGPNGMNKMIVNHLGKLSVSSDSSAILSEVDIAHPAAKLVVLAMQMQEMEVGDHTNFVVMFAGELLSQAEQLLKMGVHAADIVLGYEKALKKVQELLDEVTVSHTVDFQDPASLAASVRTVISSKQYGYEDEFAPLIANACSLVMPEDPTRFNVDNIRVCKVLGRGVLDSRVVKGMVINRRADTRIRQVQQAKIAVFANAIDVQTTDTKGTVLLNNAQQLLDFSKNEESLMEETIRGIAESGANVVLTGGKIGELALHYLNKYNIMALKIFSKFQLRRLCKTIGARPLVNLTVTQPDDLGFCDNVYTEEIGSNYVTVFCQSLEDTGVATVVVRGATKNILDDIERAIDDGVNAIKSMTKNDKFVAGAGACEVELAARLAEYADTCPGLEQYAINKFAEAMEVFPRSLAENAGLNATDMLASLYAAHKDGQTHAGIDVEEGTILDAQESGLMDLHINKYWGFKLATDAAVTILRVDEIIMSRPAGLKAPNMGGRDA